MPLNMREDEKCLVKKTPLFYDREPRDKNVLFSDPANIVIRGIRFRNELKK